MPKPSLTKEDSILEHELIDTMIAGLKEWRPDLDFPASRSDWMGCIRGLLRMYEIKRRPLVVPLRIQCEDCGGLGEFRQDFGHGTRCSLCKGRGYVDG